MSSGVWKEPLYRNFMNIRRRVGNCDLYTVGAIICRIENPLRKYPSKDHSM